MNRVYDISLPVDDHEEHSQGHFSASNVYKAIMNRAKYIRVPGSGYKAVVNRAKYISLPENGH